MFLTTPVLLLGSVAMTANAMSLPILERQDQQNGWNFSIFQTGDCSPSLGGASKHSGDCSQAQSCGPGLEWMFGSATIYSDAASHCKVTFYTSAGDGKPGSCSGPVATYPGDIQTNSCFTFDKSNQPHTFGVDCDDE